MRDTECYICGGSLWLYDFAIPMFEGEPVPHEWAGDWAGFPCCRQCFDGYERWQHDPEALRDWFNNARNPMQPANPS